MIIPRDTVDNALLALLKTTAYPFVVFSKHWQNWSNTSNQPALYLKRVRELATQVLRGQNKYVLKYEVWMYAQYEIGNEATDPYATVINPIMDALDATLNPVEPSDIQNLSLQQVANCRWNGEADIADGSVDGQVLIVIPVEVYIGIG